MEYIHEINPEYNIDIGLLRSKLDALQIGNESDLANASELLGAIDNLLYEITGRRDLDIDALQKMIDECREHYRPWIKELDAMKSEVKNRMLEYKRRAKAMIAKVREDIANGKVERSEMFLDENGRLLNESAMSIRTGEGLHSERVYYEIVVDDLSKVPDFLKTFNKKAALQYVKAGNKNVPGLIINEKRAIQYRGAGKRVA